MSTANGRIAYEAWALSMGLSSVPVWVDVDEFEKHAWEAAANAVISS